MEGLGNDYVYIDVERFPIAEPAALAMRLSDRHKGVGADGIVLIGRSTMADFRMRIFNADGSEAKMCGNGSRCVARYCYEKHLTDKTEFTLETLSGIKVLRLSLDPEGKVDSVTVDMGQAGLQTVGAKQDSVLCQDPVVALDRSFIATSINMGNPHLVLFVDDVETVDITRYGSFLEKSEQFPGGINVEFAQVVGKNHIRMRVWERGSGITMACGTGACATATAFQMAGICEGEIQVEMDGGSLFITYDPVSRKVLMRGPAEFVFEGEVEI